MSRKRYFKCKDCGGKYLYDFAATDNITICRWCSGEENEEEEEKLIPFVTFGNKELKGKQIGKTIKCERCGKRHEVEYGEEILSDGTKVPSTLLGFVKCKEKMYMVSLNGKGILGNLKP